MNDLTQETLGNLLNLIQFDKIAMIIIGIFSIVFLVRVLRQISDKVSSNIPSRRLLILQITTIVSFFLYTFGITYLVYAVLSPPKELIFALGGSIAVAVGFSLKDIASSIIAGFILIFDRPFQVGDRVKYQDIYGEVVSIGLRVVRINTLSDDLVTIPNSKFLTESVSSGNSGNLHMMITTNFHVDIESDFDMAEEIVKEVITTSRFAYLIKPVAVVFEEVEVCREIAMRITAKAYVLDVKYEKAFQTDIVKRITKSFQKNNIKRPKLGGTIEAV